MQSDYKQMTYFATTGNFIQPVEEILHRVTYVQSTASATGIVQQVGVHDSFYRIPLKSLLTKIIEIPGILQTMLDWQHRESGDAIQDVFDGEFCKNASLIPERGFNPNCDLPR